MPKSKKVVVSRQAGGKQAEISVEEIKNVRWDNRTGGYKVKSGYPRLYGYISYSLAMEIVDCSGEHDFGWNDAKVIIHKPNPRKYPEDEKYVEGYNLLEKRAGEKPMSKTAENRPTGAHPCTKQILLILEEGPIKRQELRHRILRMGYEMTTFRGAIWRMAHDGRIICEGSPHSPKQVISKK